MKCQQGGCVRDADVMVSNHSLGQVIALCREHGQWKMTEWQNAGYTMCWQTHIEDVEASAARRNPREVTQPEMGPVPEADGMQTMTIEEVLGGADPEPRPEPEPDWLPSAQEPTPEQSPARAPKTDAERDLAIATLFDAVNRIGHVLRGMAERMEELTGTRDISAAEAGITPEEERYLEELQKDAPDGAETATEAQVALDRKADGLAGDAEPVLAPPDPWDVAAVPEKSEALETLGERYTGIAQGGEDETPVPSESPKDSAADEGPLLVLQLTPKHAYHKHQMSRVIDNEHSQGSVPVHIAACGQDSAAWEPKTAPAADTKPCQKCWPT